MTNQRWFLTNRQGLLTNQQGLLTNLFLFLEKEYLCITYAKMPPNHQVVRFTFQLLARKVSRKKKQEPENEFLLFVVCIIYFC